MRTWITVVFAIILIGGGAYWWKQQIQPPRTYVYQQQVNTPPATFPTTNNTTYKHPSTQPESTATNYPLVVNPFDGWPITADNLADCESGTPVIDLEGNKSGAIKSATRVYDNHCNLLIGAKPQDFVALDFWYGKDAAGVWQLANPQGEAPRIATLIEGADPTTFALNSDYGEGNLAEFPNERFSPIYEKDKSHVYFEQLPIAGADPATFMVVDPPQRYEPLPPNFAGDPNLYGVFNAKDSMHKYLNGELITGI